MDDKYADDKHEELVTELSKLAGPIKQILKYIKKHPGEIVVKDNTKLKLTGEVNTKVMNLDEFSQPIAELLEQFEVAIEKQDKKLAEALANNKPTITIQQDFKELEKVHKALSVISDNFKKLAEREVKIVVKAPDVHVKAPPAKVEKVFIENKNPSQAIPVVLTHKSLKNFYDAIFGGGFGSVGLSVPIIESDTDDASGNPVAAVPVVNPDGSEIGGGAGGDASADNQAIQIANQNPLDKYRIGDEDSLTTTQYFGFVSSTNQNKWVILRVDKTDATAPIEYHYRYANLSNNATRTNYGAAGATGAWANRTALTYDYLYNLTGL